MESRAKNADYSARSIERVEIKQGKDVPIQIMIHMNNSAGIFQIQETLGKKIMDSPVEGYVEVIPSLSRMSLWQTKELFIN